MSIMAFCTPGGHPVEVGAICNGEPMKVPPGWSLVRASVIPAPRGADDPWEPGIWYADPSSHLSVLCCPDHPLIDTNRKEGLS
jgi:hypothetical protein